MPTRHPEILLWCNSSVWPQNEEPSNRQSDDDSKTAADIGQLSKDLSATALNQDATTTDVDDEWTAFQ